MATYYWVGGSGTWDNASTTNWSTSSGGAGGAGPPLAADIVNFDANSGTAATVTVAGTAAATTVTVNKSDINLDYTGSPTFGGTFTLTAGTITLNAQTLTTQIFGSNNTNARTIAFGTGKIVLTGNGGTIWGVGDATNLTVTGTPSVETNYSGGTGTRTISHANSAGGTEARAISITFINSATDQVNLSGHFLDVNFGTFAGTLQQTARTLYGNWTNSVSQTNTSGSNILTFAKASGTQTVTSAGKQMQPFTVNGAATTVTLADAYTLFSAVTTACTLTAGTLDLSNQTLTCFAFTATGTTTRSIAFGTGKIVLTGNSAAVWSAPTLTNFSLTGTPNIEATYSGASGTRTFSHGGTAPGSVPGQDAIAINLAITAGSDVTTFTTNGHFGNVNFTGYSGAHGNQFFRVYGDVNLGTTCTFTAGTNVFQYAKSTSGTQTITTNGRNCRAFTIAVGNTTTVRLIGNYVSQAGSATCSLTSGIFDLDGYTLTASSFTSNNTNTRTIAFGATGKFLLSGTGITIYNIPNTTNLTYTGTTWVEATAAGGTAGTTRTINNGATTGSITAAINAYVTAGTVDTAGVTGFFIDVNFTGFTGVGGAVTRSMIGNLTFGAGMTTGSSSSTTTFLGTGTSSIQSNGVVINFPVTLNSATRTLNLLDALTLGSARGFTVASGTFNSNDFTITIGNFAITGTSVRTVNLGNSQVIIQNSGNSFSAGVHTNLTLTFGSGCVVSMTAASAKNATIANTVTMPTIDNGGAGALTLTGTPGATVKLTDLTAKYASTGSGATTITLTAGVTYTFTSDFSLLGSGGNLVTLNTDVPGTQANVRKATPWYIGANSVIGSNASGFDPTTVAGYVADYISVTDVNAALSTGQDGFFMFLGI